MKACVVIPIYTDVIIAFEQIAMDQCFRILGQHPIYFVAPQRLETYISNHHYVTTGEASYKIFDDAFFADIMAYNRLLKFTGFYGSFINYDFMLIHQLDAFVFKDELLYWCTQGYDSIGAPLFEGHTDATAQSAMVSQGNGGFCLRNIRKCYDIVRRYKKLTYTRTFEDANRPFYINFYRYIKHQVVFTYSRYPYQPIINEDLFWAEVIPANIPGFNVPAPEVALKFSFEMNPEILYRMNHEQLPFGCHAWWKYNLNFWLPHLNKFGYHIKVGEIL